jgi:hypothetical protein
MRRTLLLAICLFLVSTTFSQRRLVSWSQQNIENFTKEMYDAAQKLSPAELLSKNVTDKSWAEVFSTLNASVNNYKKDTSYWKSLAGMVANNTEAKLSGTSRLVIWDRIISGDIVFEGKGLVIDNDLFTVGGRANQILQNLTGQNFGYVTMQTSEKDLIKLRDRWMDFLSNKPVAKYSPEQYKNAKIPEISGLNAVHALILSLQDDPRKDQLTKKCLKNVYRLDEMPKDSSSPANFCNPDTYTLSYLGMLFGDKLEKESRDPKRWKAFWDGYHDKLIWNGEKGIWEVKK